MVSFREKIEERYMASFEAEGAARNAFEAGARAALLLAAEEMENAEIDRLNPFSARARHLGCSKPANELRARARELEAK